MADIPPGIDIFANRQPTLYGATYATFSLATTAVALRFGSKWLTKTRRGWDDYLISAAWVVSFILVIDMSSWIHVGFGRHYELYGPSVFPGFFRHQLIADLCHAAIQVLVKLSLLAFYIRTFDAASSKSRSAAALRQPLSLLTIFLGAWFVAAAITAFLQCDPAAADCQIASRGFPLGLWLPNMATDLAVLVLPLLLLQWPRGKKQRTLLYVVFGVGCAVCFASLMRLGSLLAQPAEDLDFTWDLVPFGVWTVVENNGAIVAACLPTFRFIWLFIDADRAPEHDEDAEVDMAESEKMLRDPAWFEEAEDDAPKVAARGPATPTTPWTPGHSAPFRDDSDTDVASGRTSFESFERR